MGKLVTEALEGCDGVFVTEMFPVDPLRTIPRNQRGEKESGNFTDENQRIPRRGRCQETEQREKNGKSKTRTHEKPLRQIQGKKADERIVEEPHGALDTSGNQADGKQGKDQGTKE
jgi:hypothetical protein